MLPLVNLFASLWMSGGPSDYSPKGHGPVDPRQHYSSFLIALPGSSSIFTTQCGSTSTSVSFSHTTTINTKLWKIKANNEGDVFCSYNHTHTSINAHTHMLYVSTMNQNQGNALEVGEVLHQLNLFCR